MPTIYFVQVDTGEVKIGVSSNLGTRLKTLKTKAPTLRLIRTLDGDYSLEHEFHFFFKDQRIVGEWFRFDERMLSVDPKEVHDCYIGNVVAEARDHRIETVRNRARPMWEDAVTDYERDRIRELDKEISDLAVESAALADRRYRITNRACQRQRYKLRAKAGNR